nr:MAG TPA: hypothetical protein [Bacteriophage sp.]
MYLFSENSQEIPLSFGLVFYAIYSIKHLKQILYIVYSTLIFYCHKCFPYHSREYKPSM